MSEGATTPESLSLTESDVHKMLTAEVHVGAENVDTAMKRYIWKRRSDGQYLINLKYTWDKLILAARAIVAVANPKDVCVISAREWGQRAVLKFSKFTGAMAIAGRFTPGTFTNQGQSRDFKEPRLLIVTDTRIDHQPLLEASYVNIPTIAFCNSDSPLKYVDIVIPCNNAAPHSIGLMYWLLCREVLRMTGKLERNEDWDIMPDLFFYREPADVEKDEKLQEEARDDAGAPPFLGTSASSTGGRRPKGADDDEEEGDEEEAEEGAPARGETDWSLEDTTQSEFDIKNWAKGDK